MKSVVFVGLYRNDLAGLEYEKLKLLGEVWSLNDWYRIYDWYPDIVFQMHKRANEVGTDSLPMEHRYPGDWKLEFNKAGKTISTVKLEGITNNVVLDKEKAFEEFGESYFAGAASWMFYWAIKEKFEKVTMLGFKFRGDKNHEIQAMGTLLNIIDARERGLEVVNKHENYMLKISLDKMLEIQQSKKGYN